MKISKKEIFQVVIMSSTPHSALSVPGICIDNGEGAGVVGLSQSVPPDCYLEDLERPGILPPSPLRPVTPASSPTSCVVKRSTSLRDLQRETRRDIRSVMNQINQPILIYLSHRPLSGPLVSQCVIPRPALIPLAINKLPSITTNNETCDGGRLPGTFDSLSLVNDTGLTPSPRADTPLDLLQGGEGAALASVISRRFLSTSYLQNKSGVPSGNNQYPSKKEKSIGVFLNFYTGSNEDRHRPSPDPAAVPCHQTDTHQASDDPQEDDDKSVESYNTAASSLSLGGNVCKICHCGEEV